VVREHVEFDSAKLGTMKKGEVFTASQRVVLEGTVRLKLDAGNGWTSLTSTKDSSKFLVKEVDPLATSKLEVQELQDKHNAVVQLLLKMAGNAGAVDVVEACAALLTDSAVTENQSTVNAVLQAQVEALKRVEDKHAAAFAEEEEKMKANLAALEEAHEGALLALQKKEEALASTSAECNRVQAECTKVIRHSALLDVASFPTRLDQDFESEYFWTGPPKPRQSSSSLLIATKQEARQLLEDLDLADEMEDGGARGAYQSSALPGYGRSPVLRLKAGPRSPSRRRHMKHHFAAERTSRRPPRITSHLS
jgi:hypothetical protein